MLAVARKAAPPKKPAKTVEQYFADCGVAIGDARFTGCDRAIASGRLNKKDLALAYTNRGGEWFSRGDLDKALSDLEQALRLDPTHQWADISKAMVLLAKKQPSAALVAANAALRVEATAYAYAVRGQALQALGKRDEAMADYKEALSLNPGLDERVIVQRAYQAWGLAPPPGAGLAVSPGPKTPARPCLPPPFDTLCGDSSTPATPTPVAVTPAQAAADAKQCHTTGDAAIAACSRAIGSGHFTGKDLAQLFNERGWDYLYKKSYDAAIADYTEAIKYDPGYYDATIHRGNAYFEKKDYDRAIADYTAAIKLTSTPAVPLEERANAYLAKGSYQEAVADYSEVIKLNSGEKETYAHRGDAYRALGQVAEAIADYTKALSFPFYSFSFDVELKSTLEANLRALGSDPAAADRDAATCHSGADIDAAIAACGRAIASTKFAGHELATLYDARGSLYSGKNEWTQAIADYSEEIKLEPNNADHLADRCFNYLFGRSYDLAIADCNAAIRIDPKMARAFAILGYTLNALGRRGEAIAAFRSSLVLNPPGEYKKWAEDGVRFIAADAGPPDATTEGDAKQCRELSGDAEIAACGRAIASGRFAGNDLAELLNDRGAASIAAYDCNDAVADLLVAIALRPDDVGQHVNQARAFGCAENVEKALAEANEVIRLRLTPGVPFYAPGFADAYALRGGLLLLLRRNADGEADFKTALKFDANNAEAKEGLLFLTTLAIGAAANSGVPATATPTGTYGEAASDAEHCDKKLATCPANVSSCADAIAACSRAIASGQFSGSYLSGVYMQRGAAYLYSGNYDAAIADFVEARRLGEYANQALASLGQAYYNKRDYDRAFADFDYYARAVQADPGGYTRLLPDALILRGMALSAGNNNDRAIADFSAAIKLAPDNARAYYGRALAYALSGQREEARADLAKAVSIEPDNQDYRTALSDVDRSRAK